MDNQAVVEEEKSGGKSSQIYLSLFSSFSCLLSLLVKNEKSIYSFLRVTWLVNKEKIKAMLGMKLSSGWKLWSDSSHLPSSGVLNPVDSTTFFVLGFGDGWKLSSTPRLFLLGFFCLGSGWQTAAQVTKSAAFNIYEQLTSAFNGQKAKL
ncbi:hypothetical protein M5K25_015054 [Dendrobium thyrsiflorum]|uniref:Uncharacterized protein n=1 Tax=Dendrobium thyrsiflorum TaxID=117978 RepID=A0ABD0UPV6_DENTH